MNIAPDAQFVCDRRLDSTRFRERTGWRPPSWEDMIAACTATKLLMLAASNHCTEILTLSVLVTCFTRAWRLFRPHSARNAARTSQRHCVRASRRMGRPCFETHRSAAGFAEAMYPLRAAMLLSMRP